MASEESVKRFYSALQRLTEKIRRQMFELMMMLASDNDAQKERLCTTLLMSLEELARLLVDSDLPSWAPTTADALSKYRAGREGKVTTAGMDLMERLVALHPQVAAHQWGGDPPKGGGNTKPIDFTGIFDECYHQSRVPELFDQLVTHLEEVVASGIVDSVYTLRALEKLIATIKFNAHKSYASAKGALYVTRKCLKHIGISVLEGAPVIKHVAKGIRETVKELNSEMTKVQQEATSQTKTLVDATVPIKRLTVGNLYLAPGLPAPDTAPSTGSTEKR